MNYRHIFHAGNFADVFKHALLARMLVYLTQKDRPLRYIDTHAGIGRYDLSCPEAVRGGEWREGVGRLPSAQWSTAAASLLAPYLKAVGPFDLSGMPREYPGSPLIAQALLRSTDRLILCEAHPQDVKKLKGAINRDRRAKAIEIDGWTALRAYTPPPERRGLVLIDPPFEAPDEFTRMRESFLAAYAKWPTGMYALWRPIKDPRAAQAFVRSLVAEGVGRILRLELSTRAVREGERLAACGLIVVNPPHVLASEARILLPELSRLLAHGEGADWSVESAAA